MSWLGYSIVFEIRQISLELGVNVVHQKEHDHQKYHIQDGGCYHQDVIEMLWVGEYIHEFIFASVELGDLDQWDQNIEQ